MAAGDPLPLLPPWVSAVSKAGELSPKQVGTPATAGIASLPPWKFFVPADFAFLAGSTLEGNGITLRQVLFAFGYSF